MMNDKVEKFIEKFHFSDDINEVFTQGCCYWFARILLEWARFYDNTAEIMYDPVVGHFGARIDGRVYDITGDVTESHLWKNWLDICKEDNLQAWRLIEECMKMEDN